MGENTEAGRGEALTSGGQCTLVSESEHRQEKTVDAHGGLRGLSDSLVSRLQGEARMARGSPPRPAPPKAPTPPVTERGADPNR